MYYFWKRFTTKKTALTEAAKLRKMSKRSKVKTVDAHNHDVFVDLIGRTSSPRVIPGL